MELYRHTATAYVGEPQPRGCRYERSYSRCDQQRLSAFEDLLSRDHIGAAAIARVTGKVTDSSTFGYGDGAASD
jgi:hypothetical protein